MRAQGEDEGVAAPPKDGSMECELLLGIATVHILRKNSFQITGLPVDATSREISKHIDKLKQMTELRIATGAHRGPHSQPIYKHHQPK